MATSRISRNTKRSSSMNDRQQVQVRIRALQQRTSELYSSTQNNRHMLSMSGIETKC